MTRTFYSDGKGGDKPSYSQRRSELILSILMLTPVLFEDFLPYSMRNAMLLLAVVISTSLFFRQRDFDLRYIGVGFGWLIFGGMAVLSRVLCGRPVSYTHFALPLVCLVSCMSTSSTSWFKSSMDCATVMLCIHLVATFAFYIFPDLYLLTVKPVFFADNNNAIGYQSGLTSHYSNNAFLMAMGSLLAFSRAITTKGIERRRWGLLTGLFFGGLVLTQKRSHLMWAFLTLMVMYLTAGTRGKALRFFGFMAAASVAIVLAVRFVPGVADSLMRFTSTFESEDLAEMTTGRTFLWEKAVQEWLQRPIFGNGWGSFSFEWPGGNTTIFAHNEILQILHDTGIIGLLVFVWLSLTSLFIAARDISCLKGLLHHDYGAEISAAFFSFGFQMFCLAYSCTSGTLFQMSLVYTPYIMSVGMGNALRCWLMNQDAMLSRGEEARYA